MTDSDGGATPRRQFLEQLAATAAGLGVAACASPAAATGVKTTASPRPSAKWDDSWTTHLGHQHRFVVEIAELDSAPERLGLVTELFGWYHDALETRDRDVHIVLVLRHAAIPLVVNDAMWAKYSLADAPKLLDPATGEPAKRNPYVGIHQGDVHAKVAAETAIDALQRRGVIVLGCNMALQGLGGRLARKAGASAESVRSELTANLLPGVILQLNGVYAVTRAEDAGCVHYQGANS